MMQWDRSKAKFWVFLVIVVSPAFACQGTPTSKAKTVVTPPKAQVPSGGQPFPPISGGGGGNQGGSGLPIPDGGTPVSPIVIPPVDVNVRYLVNSQNIATVLDPAPGTAYRAPVLITIGAETRDKSQSLSGAKPLLSVLRLGDLKEIALVQGQCNSSNGTCLFRIDASQDTISLLGAPAIHALFVAYEGATKKNLGVQWYSTLVANNAQGCSPAAQGLAQFPSTQCGTGFQCVPTFTGQDASLPRGYCIAVSNQNNGACTGPSTSPSMPVQYCGQFFNFVISTNHPNPPGGYHCSWFHAMGNPITSPAYMYDPDGTRPRVVQAFQRMIVEYDPNVPQNGPQRRDGIASWVAEHEYGVVDPHFGQGNFAPAPETFPDFISCTDWYSVFNTSDPQFLFGRALTGLYDGNLDVLVSNGASTTWTTIPAKIQFTRFGRFEVKAAGAVSERGLIGCEYILQNRMSGKVARFPGC